MDAIREQLNRPLIAGIVGAVVGLILGLFFAWQVWPVEWTDLTPETLRADLQDEWLRLSINNYALTDPAMAVQRYEELGEAQEDTLARLLENPVGVEPQALASFRDAVAAGGVPVPGETPGVTPTEEPVGGIAGALPLLAAFCVFVLVLVGAAVAFFLLRGRGRGTGAPARQQIPQADWSEYAAEGEEPPMAQFMASYKLGDDLFDDSFSIDSPSGEFLGECGVGISETIGVGDPKKVTAFEVWLFDKNDIQTVTKVVMSEHAFGDDSIRQRLAAKGEPVLAAPGGEVVLETQTLQLVARIIDMNYGDGALPEDSYFDNIVLQLAIWQK